MTTTTKASGKKATYIRHSQEYKGEALKLTAAIGVAKAARQLNLHESQLYQWRKHSEHTKSVSEREAALAAENVRLKRQLARQAYDNACAESFFHSLKVEAIHGERFITREAMHQTVFEYIETDYNRLRLHAANHYRSPVNFEAHFYQQPAS